MCVSTYSLVGEYVLDMHHIFSQHRGSPRTRKRGKKILQTKNPNEETRKKTNFHLKICGRETVVMPPKQTKRVTGTVGEGATGKKTKATQHADGQSVSEKSQPHELVRKSLRNQTVRHNISSVKSRTDG